MAMSSSKQNIYDGIEMHNPSVYYLCDYVGDYTDIFLLIIGNIMSHVETGFVVLVFIPAKKYEETKPLLQRSDIDTLSYQSEKDGTKNFGLGKHEDSKKQSIWNEIVDEIKKAYAYYKDNQQQNFVILLSPNNHGGLKVKYQFLEADDIQNVAVVCDQSQIPDDKAVCFIDISTHQKLTGLPLHKQSKKQNMQNLKTSNQVAHVHVSDPAKGRKLNYEDLEDRMRTFKLPPQWEGPVEYQSMAEAGFVYTGQEDLVFCFNCNIKLDRWSKDMEPLLRHKEESPICSFMRQKLQAVKGERGKTKSVVAPSKPLNSRLTSSIGQLQSSSLVASKSIHTVVTGLNEPRLSYGHSFDDRSGASLPITPENYQSEEERIKSFVGWPLNEAVHPEQLARVGFVYTGDGALVQCFQCGVKYRQWYKGDVPLSIHQKCNPRCSFLQNLVSKSKSPPPERRPNRSYIQPESLPVSSNTQSEEVSKHSLQFPDYSDQAIRLESFKHWGGVLPAHELAEAGFYMIARRDIVRCHSCNVVVQEWEKSDNVIDEHRRLSPSCSFLKQFLSSRSNTEILSPPSSIDKIGLCSMENSLIRSKSNQPNTLETTSIASGNLLSSMKSRGSSKSPDEDTITGIRYPPSWGQHRSMSPQRTSRKTSEGSDESFQSAESHHKPDYTMLSSLDPPKTKIMYEESLSEGLENNISIKTSDTRGDDTAAPGMGLCQICYDKKIDCIFLPCGHARTCEGCATRIKNSGQPCPYCRKGVSTTHRIFL